MSSSRIRTERVKKLDLQKLYSFYFFLTFHLNQKQKCIQNQVKHLIRKNLHLRGFKGLWIFLLKCNLFSYWFKFNRSKNIHAFFLSDIFFNSASVLLNFIMKWASNVAWVLLNTCNHHYTETYFIFSVFGFISRSRSKT